MQPKLSLMEQRLGIMQSVEPVLDGTIETLLKMDQVKDRAPKKKKDVLPSTKKHMIEAGKVINANDDHVDQSNGKACQARYHGPLMGEVLAMT